MNCVNGWFQLQNESIKTKHHLINVPFNFSKSVRIKFILCDILPEIICIWNAVYEICAKTFLEGTFMCTPSFLVCAHLMACVCARTHAQLRGNIALNRIFGNQNTGHRGAQYVQSMMHHGQNRGKEKT